MPFIIDGYNLLHLAQNQDHGFGSMTDIDLCRHLDKYLKQTGEKGQIVFDGIGPPDKNGFNNLTRLEIIFSGQNKDADSVIENKISLSTAPKLLTIVSSDRRIRSAAMARKATSVKSDQFWIELERQLNRKRHPKDPSEKHHGLNQGETEQWMKIFGIE